MGFKAVHLKQTEKAFKKFAENVVARAKWNLANRKGKPGKKFSRGASDTKSKKLSDSLGYYLKVYPSGSVELQFGAEPYWKYVEYGRRAGSKAPPPSAIRNWIRRKPLRIRDLSTGKYISKNEKNINSTAYVIGRSISEKGIPPRYFWRDAFNMHYKRLPNSIAQMYAKDVANFMRATMDTMK